jgi:hypothetical protein
MTAEKVFIGLFYETVVVTCAAKRADAAAALRKELEPRHRKEASNISLLNHVALLFWSEERSAYWYRLPSTNETCAIHSDRVALPLRSLVPPREPDRPTWLTNTSGAKPPR